MLVSSPCGNQNVWSPAKYKCYHYHKCQFQRSQFCPLKHGHSISPQEIWSVTVTYENIEGKAYSKKGTMFIFAYLSSTQNEVNPNYHLRF